MCKISVFLLSLLLLLPGNPSAPAQAAATRSCSAPVFASPDQELLSTFLKMGLSETTAYLVLAQARLESGHFSSVVFHQNCNPFGMKQAKNRATTALGTHRGHAVYANLSQAAHDFVLWMKKTRMPMQIDQPMEYLCHLQERNYFEEDNQKYARILLAIFHKIKPVAA